jgi:integrase
MATINFILKSKKNPANLYVRFLNTRAIDYTTPTGLLIAPSTWDKKNQRLRNLMEIEDREEVNTKLSMLKIHLLNQHNISIMSGDIIDKVWLCKNVSKYFNRPMGEVNRKQVLHYVYLSDFIRWFLDELSPTYRVKTGEYMPEKTKKVYEAVLLRVQKFELLNGKIKFRDANKEMMESIQYYFINDDYAPSTVKQYMVEIKYMMARADELNIEINKGYKVSLPTIKKDNVAVPYLTIDEINTLYNHDFSDNPILDRGRDLFIVGLWTGLRVSDFMKLDTSNIRNGNVEKENQKTGYRVVIPIHKHIQAIFDKYDGGMPEEFSSNDFNIHIKDICKAAGFNRKMEGKVLKKGKKEKGQTKRKAKDTYFRYELITSHICRRSFATNLYGKIPNQSLMALGGWTQEKIMLHYVKDTNTQAADDLKKFYEGME